MFGEGIPSLIVEAMRNVIRGQVERVNVGTV